MKKSSLFLSLLSLLALTGCGRTVSKEDAKTYAKENFSREKVEEKYSSYSVTTKTEIKKSKGFFESIFEVGKEEKTQDGYDIKNALIFNENYIDMLPEDAKITKLFGNITVTYNLTVEDILGKDVDGIEGSAVATMKVNNLGLLASQSVTTKYKIDSEFGSGVKVTGELYMIESTTYTYQK